MARAKKETVERGAKPSGPVSLSSVLSKEAIFSGGAFLDCG